MIAENCACWRVAVVGEHQVGSHAGLDDAVLGCCCKPGLPSCGPKFLRTEPEDFNASFGNGCCSVTLRTSKVESDVKPLAALAYKV